jgi:hypothetical protein
VNLHLKRYDLQPDHTKGLLYVDGKFTAFTLEDAVRDRKVPGATAIPDGTYRILPIELETPLTRRYRKYGWFKWHLELKGVPGFTNVYIHPGNSHSDTNGCILVGNQADVRGVISESLNGFESLYRRIYAALDNGQTVTITISSQFL